MTKDEWDELWWEEFLRRRKADPTRDLLELHGEVRKWMERTYGPQPAAVRTGPPWWAKVLALVAGVPMFSGIWAWFNGKKLIIGTAITVLAILAGAVPAVLVAVGANAVLVAKVVGIFTMVVGLAHKAYKFLYNEEHQ